MMKDLSKYSYINAVIRSKISNIFSENDFDNFRHNMKYNDIVDLLVPRKYIDQNSISMDSSITNIEYNLFLHLNNAYGEIMHFENDKDVKEFIKVLLLKLEIKNLKNCLRIWLKKDEALYDYVYKKPIVNEINYEQIFQAEGIEAVIRALESTPYYSVLNPLKEKFLQNSSLFLMEVELDKYYYRQITDNLSLLNKRDVQIVKKFFAFEVDVLNFSMIMRFKNYYNLDYNAYSQYMIPFIGMKSRGFAEEISLKDDMPFSMMKIFSAVPEYILKDLDQKLSTELNLKNKMMLIADLLNQVISIEIRNTLSHYPFTIGIIIVYFLLKDIEVSSLISILNLKYYEVI